MSLHLDIRQAHRALLRSAPLTLATIVILGLGIGAATTRYGVTGEVMLRSPAVRSVALRAE